MGDGPAGAIGCAGGEESAAEASMGESSEAAVVEGAALSGAGDTGSDGPAARLNQSNTIA
ncbi:hypothetical protein LBMAG41_03680 [Cyanobium sp.]|nr:hypothetical protein LBMAG41_03680 [Cyanobium sp.]